MTDLENQLIAASESRNLPSDRPMFKSRSDGSVSKDQADKPNEWDFDSAIAVANAVADRAQKYGRTPLEQVEFESKNGNKKPQEALTYLRNEQEKLKTAENNVPQNTKEAPGWVKDLGMATVVVAGVTTAVVLNNALEKLKYPKFGPPPQMPITGENSRYILETIDYWSARRAAAGISRPTPPSVRTRWR